MKATIARDTIPTVCSTSMAITCCIRDRGSNMYRVSLFAHHNLHYTQRRDMQCG